MKYYGQRAGAGLIITEGISPSPNGLGYPRIPGLFNADQMKSWRLVTDTVHKNGGKIFAQLMHCGRVGQALNLPAGAQVMGPSALTAPGEMWTDAQGLKPHTPPREMTESDIQNTIREYAQSCQLAMEAGFDGVELHGANGYMIEQFLNTASNQRTDKWGGSVENRVRFAVEVAKACVAAVGANRLGMRLSPYGVFNGMAADPQTDAVFTTLVSQLSQMNFLYIHIVDHSSMGAPAVSAELKAKMRSSFKGAYILSGGYEVQRATADLIEKKGDLVAFGRPFIANPDLVEKLKNGKELKSFEQSTLYTPGEKGYTDY